MTRKLTLSTGSFDHANTFRVSWINHGRVSLKRDYVKEGDGIYWFMLHASCISSHNSAERVAEINRLNVEAPVADGEVVEIEGELYRVDARGPFSTCAVLEKIN